MVGTFSKVLYNMGESTDVLVWKMLMIKAGSCGQSEAGIDILVSAVKQMKATF